MLVHPGAWITRSELATMSNDTPIPEGYKRCSRGDKCAHPNGPILPLAEFYKSRSEKDGHGHACKACRHEYNVKTRDGRREYDRQYKDKNRERITQRRRKYTARTRERKAAYDRAYYQANKERIREREKEYRQRNRERENSWRRVYMKENRARFRDRNTAAVRRRRARRHGADGFHTEQDIRFIYDRQGGRCWWCQCELNGTYEVDHRVPLSRGGSNDPSNLVVSCMSCNRRKHNKLPHEWNGRLL